MKFFWKDEQLTDDAKNALLIKEAQEPHKKEITTLKKKGRPKDKIKKNNLIIRISDETQHKLKVIAHTQHKTINQHVADTITKHANEHNIN
jgi:predicted HicB family RNase H-like nuclease